MTSFRGLRTLGLLAAMLVAVGCGSSSNEPLASEKLITLFTGGPSNIVQGEKATLVFSAAAATTLSIAPDVGDVTGLTSMNVSPSKTTTYTLTATKGGKSQIATLTISVGAPAANGFRVTAGQDSLTAGQSATLTLEAVNAKGEVLQGFVGTVNVVSNESGTGASIPATIDFTAQDAGHKTFPVTLVTAGERVLIVSAASNASTQGVLRIPVQPAAAASFALQQESTSVRAGDGVALTVTAKDGFGNVATGYRGTIHVTTTDASAVVPADATFTQADAGRHQVSVSFHTAGDRTVTVTDTAASTLQATGAAIHVRNGPSSALALTGPTDVAVDAASPFTITAKDRFGNVATDYQGTVRISTTDAAAAPLADVAFAAADVGVKTVDVTLSTAGDQTVSVADVADATLAAASPVKVKPGTATQYVLSAMPDSAVAGSPLTLTITAEDARGNVVKDYAGQAHVGSSDATDVLPQDGGFVNGVRSVSVAYTRTGSHSVTVSEVGGTISASSGATSVSNAPVAALVLSAPASTQAGQDLQVTVAAKDRFGNLAADYTGTVSFTATDARANLAAPHTFTSSDAGQTSVTLQLLSSGQQTLSVTDGSFTASAAITVTPAPAARCVVSSYPDTATAGAPQTARVTVQDAFGGQVTNYSGTFAVTSTDPSAQLAPVTLGAQDQGTQTFGFTLFTAGPRTLTLTDAASGLTCSASGNVVAGAPVLSVSVPGSANASYPVPVNVAVKDAYGNANTTFAGTISFASTDAAATVPAAITLTGSEGGVAATTVTYNTLGAQTLTVSAPGASNVTVSTTVHGFVYTNPASGVGRVRLVVNAGASNAGVVQLDLVSNAAIFATSSGGRVRGGVYAAGMNLPVDTTRAMADAKLLVIPTAGGTALNLGSAPQAVAAALPTSGTTANVLYTGVSQKASGAGATSNDVTLRAGQIFYSVRLRLAPSATVGTVFDATNLGPKFRAAVRSASGDDAIAQSDFAIGTLEVR